ncbi:stalk domain-containing protein [Anoxynatronum sibiricum]|uniref:Stalk domain-containing protein n=1 Tax=Anoxynatronum sibiricum TaxID=210623 RepID=A0ABU9VVN9_9CLOT
MKATKKMLSMIPLLFLTFFSIIPVYGNSPAADASIAVRMTINEQQAYINNQVFSLEAPPMIRNGRALVPLRFFSEALGAHVEWIASQKQVIVTNDSQQIILKNDSQTALVNGRSVQLSTPTVIVNGRIFVPLRFVSEVLGFSVSWDAVARTVTIAGRFSDTQELASVMSQLESRDHEHLNQETHEQKNTTTGRSPFSHDERSIELEVLRLINEKRHQENLQPLSKNDHLMYVATQKSKDLVDNNYFSHTSPVYGEMRDMLDSFNVNYRRAGENIAAGQRTAEQVVSDWMNSPGHRQNILNPEFTQIGIGAVNGGPYGGITWTQLFTD